MACERCMIQWSIDPDSFRVRFMLRILPRVRIIHGTCVKDENV